VKDFSEYLKKFTFLLKDKTAEVRVIIEIIEKVTGATLEEKQLTIKNGILFVSASPLLKNNIYMSKETILSLCKERGVNTVTQIR
jgi:predicted HicB family RNase H-like nuclease